MLEVEVSLGLVEIARRRIEDDIASRQEVLKGGESTIVVGLVGRGIQASKTPAMHEREGARVGLPYSYVLIDFDALGLPDDALGAMLDEAERLGFSGVNVTHPFKQAVLAHLGALSPEAATIGAVNTVVFHGGARVGHNTDYWGFAESFREGLAGVKLTSVVQCGAGGAGAAVALALMTMGAAHLVICDPEIGRAEQLVSRFHGRFDTRLEAVSYAAPHTAAADGLVNATPIGMAKYPGMAFAPDSLSPTQWVAEIVYFPLETELLRVARSLGCRTLAGTGMAVYQAIKAFELFTGIAPDRAAMIEHFRAAA